MLQTIRGDSDGGGINYVTGSIINRMQKMEKTLKIWHAVMATIGLLITIGGFIIVQTNKLENQKIRIEFLESDARDKSLQIRDLNQQQAQQYKEINSKLTDILISLQNKANK